LQRAIAASSTASQTAIICGPAIGGLLYVFGASTVYLTCTAVFVLASVLVSFIQMQRTPPDKKPVTVKAVFRGLSLHPPKPGGTRGDLARSCLQCCSAA
jgi:hypothetical protein